MKKVFLITSFTVTLSLFSNEPPSRLEHAHLELAEALSEQGDAQTAVHHYKKVLEYNETHPRALFRLGCLLHQLGNHDSAIEFFEQRLQNNPSCARTEFGLGTCWKKKGELEHAIQHFYKAHELNPQAADICYELGKTLEQNKQLEQTAQIYQKTLALKPNAPSLLERQFHVLSQLHRYEQALTCCNKLLALGVGGGKLMVRRAHLLCLCGKLDEAREQYNELLSYLPNDSKLLFNIAHTYTQSGISNQALAYYQQSLVADPKNKRACLGIAQTLLYEGDYEQGWEALAHYNMRCGKKITLSLTENLTNKIVLISGEWLHEDMIQFVRYAQHLQELGATVIVQTPKALAPLLKRCPYVDDVVVMHHSTHHPHHKMIPLLSLPHLFGTSKTNIPTDMPYLHANPELIQHWRNKLPSGDNLNVGIHLYKKSGIPLAPFFELADNDNINFCVIQTDLKTELPKGLSNNASIHLIGTQFTEQNGDLNHLAAIIKNLDLVITGDSTIAHLAGALNIPVWVLLPPVASWRWQANRDDCQWYPSMKLFRREKEQEWNSVVEMIAEKLKNLNQNF